MLPMFLSRRTCYTRGRMKIDLHNHTIYSHDSVNRLEHFEKAYAKGKFDAVAITDHDRIDAAHLVKKQASFPVIVGEEITTQQGDVIGLFIDTLIPANLSAREAAQIIRDQDGLVYIPHPFDRLQLGMRENDLLTLAKEGLVDMIECYNDAFQTVLLSWSNGRIQRFVNKHSLVAAAGSDSHIPRDIGQAYVEVADDHRIEELANDPKALLEAVRHGQVVGTTRFSPLSLAAKTYGHLRRKLIREPEL